MVRSCRLALAAGLPVSSHSQRNRDLRDDATACQPGPQRGAGHAPQLERRKELRRDFSLACGTIVALRSDAIRLALGEGQAACAKNYETSYRYRFQLITLFLR